ncbi:TetR/AcrR family transcriptional regulator [Streptomyces sp. NPDC020983]|uniref:TetR/AcrR family transcriptional regulator n=1 Tax=Streptomyces sp. NPDC020983 TaxID=3365106 RepID=UPI003790C15F
MVRMSAEERRESVVRAAMSEFAHGGYHGTSTEAIARRVGVSQPYLFRLFPNKQAIFLAASRHCIETTIKVFADAAVGVPVERRLDEMGKAYQAMIHADPERLLMQMQTYVAVAAAEAAGDRAFGEEVRAVWMQLWDTVRIALGTDVDETTQFFAYGMLINTLVSLGFSAGDPIWEGFYESSRPGTPQGPQDAQEQGGPERPAAPWCSGPPGSSR